jgi:hypothetical protein
MIGPYQGLGVPQKLKTISTFGSSRLSVREICAFAMADLATLVAEVQSIKVTLSALNATVAKQISPHNGRHSGKSRQQTRSRAEIQPQWITILDELSKLCSAVERIDKALRHGHNVNCDERGVAEQPQDREQHLPQQTSTSSTAAANDRSSVSVSNIEAGQQRADGLPLIGITSSTQRLGDSDAASQTTSSKTAFSPNSGQIGSAESYSEAVERTNPSPLVSSESLSLAGELKFSLSIEDMREKLVPSLMRLAKDDRFTGLISVQGIEEVNWADLTSSIQPPPKDYDLLSVQYSNPRTVQGVVELRLSDSDSTEFAFPDFSQPVEEPSREACLDYLRRLINKPPSSTIPYYVGPPLMSATFNQLLHPGEALLKFPCIEGANTIYWHAGERGSGTAFHCEDMALYSVNLVLYGWKLWILIRLSHTEKFEAFVRRHWPNNGCDQFVRHNLLLISMETLQNEGIEFDIHIAGPGQVVMTKPRQYYAVVNITKNMAVAINFTPPDEPIMDYDLPVCPECGLHPLPDDKMRRIPYKPTLPVRTNKRQGNPGISQPREKRQRCPDAIQPGERRRIGRHSSRQQAIVKLPQTTGVPQDLKGTAGQIKKIDTLCHLPSMKGKPPVTVFKLVAAIGSRAAIQQFFTLVAEIRSPGNTAGVDAIGDSSARAIQRALRIKTSERKSTLAKFLIRLDQVFLVQELNMSKGGRIRTDEKLLRKIEERASWSKATLEHQRKTGNKWNRVCGDYTGLLCFIFLDSENPFSLCPEDYLSMTDPDLEVFHRLLEDDYFESIRSAGKAFQESLNITSADVEFCWEGRETPLNPFSEKDILPYLKPFPSTFENVYDKDKFYNQPRPSAWPEDRPWPEDPTWLPPDDRQCDLCSDTSCNCIRTKTTPKLMPRIKDYGSKGRGLQAVAQAPGCYAYKKGDKLGVFSGVLEPLKKSTSDKWTLQLVREDLSDSGDFGSQNPSAKPIVGLIRCAEKGSYLRLANYACRASATLVGMHISGRYTLVAIATKNILHGEEITINYGKGSLGGSKCLCIDCVDKQPDACLPENAGDR